MSLLCVGSVWIGALGACAWADGRTAAADPPGLSATLIDASLNERRVRVLRIDAGEVTFADAEGRVRTEALDGYAALIAPGETAVDDEAAILELVDGQRLIGAPVEAAGAEAVGWVHPVFGELEVPLERVLRIGLAEAARPAAPGAAALDDVVVLVNGDRLSGFVEGVGASVRLETDGQTVEVPLDRAAEVRLANPAEGARGTVIWFADGTVVRARRLRTAENGTLNFGLALAGPEEAASAPGTLAPREAKETTPAGWMEPVRLGDVRAIAFDAAALAPLAGLEPVEQRPLGERRWTRPAEVGEPGLLGLADVTLPGPMSVMWEVPGRAMRLALEAELPESMWTWGDCELVIAAVGAGGDAEVFAARLNAERPTASVNVALPEGTRRVRVSLRAGEYGPVQDRVVLRRAIVLLDAEEPGA